MALASTDDYETITGQPVDNAAQVDALLEIASEAVLAGAHGQNIIETTYEDATLYNSHGVFRFPQRPVSAVASVTVDGVELSTDDYRFTPGGSRRHAYLIRRVDGFDSTWPDAECVVTYTAGWANVPMVVKAAVVAMAEARIAAAGGQVLAAETLGGHREEFVQASAQTTDMAVPSSTQKILDRMCGVPRDQSVPIVSDAPQNWPVVRELR